MKNTKGSMKEVQGEYVKSNTNDLFDALLPRRSLPVYMTVKPRWGYLLAGSTMKKSPAI